ncbi:hypothetical protein SLEP1_g42405 [Rubroshorea leprosula]|uniref:Uncharacterized protein n=1 Tax=Rubroshorea leprosula TaxID=152421 RepID=A0AAV5LA52_9ROSI|nr:hypothetical protein SLEP1_g42405 [Rubroshorea leprosula]
MGNPPSFPEVYTSRRQHRPKGKDQLPTYCNDEAREISEKLASEYATKEGEEGFDPTQIHGDLLMIATDGMKRGWLKGLDIHTHQHDVGVSARREPLRPPIMRHSPQVEELQQTVQSLKDELQGTQVELQGTKAELQASPVEFKASRAEFALMQASNMSLAENLQFLYQQLGMTPPFTNGATTPRTPHL